MRSTPSPKPRTGRKSSHLILFFSPLLVFAKHSCSDYVRHLISLNKEKEAAVEQAKKDLAAKHEKMEEEQRTQQDPSDPESTTSSLTVSSGSEGVVQKKSPGEDCCDGDLGKKSRHFESHESTVSSGSSSESAKQAILPLSLGAASTVSDITDSNKGGSYSKGSSKMENVNTDGVQESAETVSADAAAGSHHRRHKDVVVAVSTKSDSGPSGTDTSTATPEKTSLDSDFQLDYQEVFLKSNVPQLLASTNGRIVAFNDFFLRASGLSRKQVEFLTIFSLVQTSLLSNLFEIVAAALRSGDSDSTEAEETKDEQSEENSQGGRKITPLKDYAAITLPCVDFSTIFREDYARTTLSEPEARQLYMTVTLMNDDDVRKRCFHCAFTDCPGTKGALGSVTPELLSALFAKPADLPPIPSPQNEPEETDVEEATEDMQE